MTTATAGGQQALAERIDTVEEVYEFMLAYAAQGRRGDDEGANSNIRESLLRVDAALGWITGITADNFAVPGEAVRHAYGAFIDVLRQDAAKARAAVQLVLAQRAISSQLIDNLNASIHVRALLTDLFLIDESLKGGAA